MKAIRILFLLFLAAKLGCSDELKPGEGPGFSSLNPAPTASDLWILVSRNTYTEPLVDPITFDIADGEGNCSDGGAVKGETSADAFVLTFSQCGFEASHAGVPIQLNLEATGVYELRGFLSVRQHASFGGDLGFSADCDFSSELVGTSYSFSGLCTYRDSDGEELTITGEEMTEAECGEAACELTGPS